jgi:RNA polymerase sigma-70 factor (ECF subfamily)
MMAAATFEARNVAESDLIACVPHLRAFAWFLTKNRERADDLVQDAIVRVLAEAHQFEPCTNLKVWMFTILHNLHYNELRESLIRIQSLDDPLEYEPAALPSQIASLEFGDFRRALWKLNDDWREALILIGASGLSYEEVAKVCECSPGTVKSRVSRARRELLRILEDDLLADKRCDTPALAGYVGHLLDSKRAASPAASAQYERRLSLAHHAAPFGS